MISDYIIVIPARYGSTRLQGKPLIDINGKPLIQHVYERCLLTRASKVYVATDDHRVVDVIGGESCIMTSPECVNGTERVYEATQYIGLKPHARVVNVQGDMYLFNPQWADYMGQSSMFVTTLCNIEEKGTVNVVYDDKYNALYFSRHLPYGNTHVGIYGYNVEHLKLYNRKQASIEKEEKLEQLRFLWLRQNIIVMPVKGAMKEINTTQDLEDLL